jgi:hypothetical protein
MALGGHLQKEDAVMKLASWRPFGELSPCIQTLERTIKETRGK